MNCLLRKFAFLLVVWLLPLLLLIASSFATEECSSFICEKFNICVAGGLSNEQQAVCAEAQKASDFFQHLELDFPVQLKIALKQQVQPGDHMSIGCYYPKANRILLLDYQSAEAASRSAPPAFGTLMTFALWRSYIVHEITHAIVESNFTANDDAIAPTEYIAAVAQLSTLPDDVFESILSNYKDVGAFKDESEITDLYYFMKPCEFAVKAYLHYSKSENGQSFIRKLLQEGLPGSGIRSEIPFF